MNITTTKYLIYILAVIALAVITSTISRKLLSTFIKKYANKINTNPTNFSFLKNSVSFFIYSAAIITIFIKIPFLKSIGTAMFAGAGIMAAIIGFAAQKAFSNIINGLFILIFKPFRVEDIIEIKDNIKGIVEEITLRHTIIKNYENKRVIIPNSTIGDEIIVNNNITDEKIRAHILFSISFNSNIDIAMNIMREEIVKHPLYLNNDPLIPKNEHEELIIRVVNIGEYAVEIKAYAWASNNDNAFILKCDLLKSIKERFDKEGVEIPLPYRSIIIKKDTYETK